jgi:hypothetical protein
MVPGQIKAFKIPDSRRFVFEWGESVDGTVGQGDPPERPQNVLIVPAEKMSQLPIVDGSSVHDHDGGSRRATQQIIDVFRRGKGNMIVAVFNFVPEGEQICLPLRHQMPHSEC